MGMPSPRAMIAACELALPDTDTAPNQPGFGEADQVGRVHLAADEDKVPGRRRGGAAAGQAGEHGVGDLPHVVRAGGQVRVGQRGDRRGLDGG